MNCNSTRRRFLRSAAITGVGAAVFPGMLAAEFGTRSTRHAVEQAHVELWRKYVDRNGLILDYIGDLPTPEDCALGRPNALGWGSPIEDGTMLAGLYLPAACERARRSKGGSDKAKVHRLVKGLLKSASISDVPGFITRGFGSDGRCHYPLGSDDQTHPWFYGLNAYLQSGLPSKAEQTAIKFKMTQVATALEIAGWNCPGDGDFKGQFRGSYKGGTFRDAARYLYMLLAMYRVTHDDVWLERYKRASSERIAESGKTRAEICAGGIDLKQDGLMSMGAPSLWIYMGSQASLAYLSKMDPEATARARFHEGLQHGAKDVIPYCEGYKNFDKDDKSIFGTANWRAGYPNWFAQKTPADAVRLSETADKEKLGERKAYEIRNMRNPLAAATIVAMSGDSAYRDTVERAIQHYDYSRINLSAFFFAECAYYSMPQVRS